MSIWRQLTRGLRVLTHRSEADQDVADEVQNYLDETAAALEADGLPPGEARRAARLELGNVTVVREQVRAYGWENLVGTVLADLRYAARGLRHNRGFAVVVVLTLALGIGAVTAIFSAVNPILFSPLPYPDSSRITMIWYAGADGSRASQAFGTFRELAARSRAYDSMAVFKPWQRTMTGPAEPDRFEGQLVTALYFRVLGVAPALGQDFNPADDEPNGPKVVILSDAIWRRRFDADPAIVGRQIKLNDSFYAVIGVMPRGLDNVLAPSAEIWSLLQYDPTVPPQGREWGHHLHMVGRLAAGTGIDQARRELDSIARVPVTDYPRQPGSSMNRGMIVSALQDDITRAIKPALLAVFGAVMLLLAIACVNVVNLFLARGARRRGEFSMRAALGAGRSRLIRQVLTESLLLAILGGTVGMAIAAMGVRALVALSPAGLPRSSAIGLDATAFAFAFGISTLVGLAVGLVPAVRASRDDLRAGVQQGSRHVAGHQLTRRLLVVGEVALALVLLVSAGLLLRSLDHLFAIAPGFDASPVLTMQVHLSSPQRYPDDAAFHRFYAQALDAVRRVPGVAEAGFTNMLPMSGDDASIEVYGVRFEQQPGTGSAAVDAYRYGVTPGYLEAMGIPLRRGRLLDSHDGPGAPVRPVLISESFAKRIFGNNEALGQRLRFGGPADRPWDVIVGVVGDVRQTSLATPQSSAVYVSSVQWLWAESPLWLVVRARGDAAALTPVIRNAIWSVDKDQPIVRVATLVQLLARSEAERRFVLIIFEAFGLAALALAAIGIFGVLSGSVTERTREIGVRSALGASRRTILILVLRQGMLLTGLGVVIGGAGATVASGAILTLLFGVSRFDPVTYAGVIVLMIGVAGIACWMPAWRAARIDPAITLRAE